MGWVQIATLALQAAAPTTPSAPSNGTERLVAPMPAGFKLGFESAQGDQTIEERVPVGETVENWTRMVTVQRFRTTAIGAHPLLDRLGGLFARSCPGTIVAPIVDDMEDGHPVASIRVDCPRNAATGKPETMLARAFQGATDLHVLQYAFRSVPTPRQVSEATAYLAAARLCPSAGANCRKSR